MLKDEDDKKEILIKIDSKVYNDSIKYGIDIQEFINKSLRDQIFEISTRLKRQKIHEDWLDIENKKYLYNLIKKVGKESSNVNFVTEAYILAEAELEGIHRNDVKVILDELEDIGYIYQPAKSCYKITKVRPTF